MKEFDNGSRILFRAITPSMGRGLAFDTLIIDNAAYVMEREFRDFWTSMYPVMGSGRTKVIMASTPGKPQGVFYDIWSKAPINGFERMTIPWHACPGRDREWFEHMQAALGESSMQVQFQNLFEGEGALLTASAS